jgi:hypothetical protein
MLKLIIMLNTLCYKKFSGIQGIQNEKHDIDMIFYPGHNNNLFGKLNIYNLSQYKMIETYFEVIQLQSTDNLIHLKLVEIKEFNLNGVTFDGFYEVIYDNINQTFYGIYTDTKRRIHAYIYTAIFNDRCYSESFSFT